MTATLATAPPLSKSLADRALSASGTLWFLTAAAGQWMFVLYISSFYGGAAVQGNFEKWNDVLVGGYVAGGTLGNIILAGHLLLAVTITAGGTLQLIPQIRARALPFHRWNGRVYILTALVISLFGLYMVWTRGTAGGESLRIGISLNGILILVCAVLAWRYALARDIATHRRWALRTFMLVSGVWFFRVGLMLWILANHGPVGIGRDFDGPFVRFWSFGCYLVPLIVLELYLRSQERGSATDKFAAAAALVVLTAAMAVGILGAAMGMWLPRVMPA
ncbi:MAG: DUF2306 domain-containing protein [Alphaproteobacteria bacterium]|nr:DUF2306 domain-containing protein [Alphaproteobacteria bacterium]